MIISEWLFSNFTSYPSLQETAIDNNQFQRISTLWTLFPAFHTMSSCSAYQWRLPLRIRLASRQLHFGNTYKNTADGRLWCIHGRVCIGNFVGWYWSMLWCFALNCLATLPRGDADQCWISNCPQILSKFYIEYRF